jgi:hypothetical protein
MRFADGTFAGAVANDGTGYIRAAVEMYSDETRWSEEAQRGRKYIAEHYDWRTNSASLLRGNTH